MKATVKRILDEIVAEKENQREKSYNQILKPASKINQHPLAPIRPNNSTLMTSKQEKILDNLQKPALSVTLDK